MAWIIDPKYLKRFDSRLKKDNRSVLFGDPQRFAEHVASERFADMMEKAEEEDRIKGFGLKRQVARIETLSSLEESGPQSRI